MLRSSSKSSFSKKSLKQKYLNDPNQIFIKKIEDTLNEACQVMSYLEFQQFYQRIVKQCIKKAQIQKKQNIFIPFIRKILTRYKPSVQISVRSMLLQSKSQCSVFPQQSLQILNKVKHMVINTEIEYILSKVFVQQAFMYGKLKQIQLQQKSLQKCIRFTQTFLIEYLKQKEQIRRQITENIIMSYFQLYKLKKQTEYKLAEQYLNKAYRTSQKIFGQQSQLTEMLSVVCINQKNVRKSIQKISQNINSVPQNKAITEIINSQIKKGIKVKGFYLWQDEKIVVQIVRQKVSSIKVLSQTEYSIKLNMNKINLLRDSNWVQILNGQVLILEEQLLKAIGIKQQNTVATRIGLKNISRDDIIKKDSLDSSQEDPSFIEKQDFNFIRRLGRAQSAKRQQNQ